MAGILPTPPLLPTPQSRVPVSTLPEPRKCSKVPPPSRIRRNSSRLLEYNRKKAEAVIRAEAESKAQDLLDHRAAQTSKGLKLLKEAHTRSYNELKDKLYRQIRVLQKRLADKEAQCTDLFIRLSEASKKSERYKDFYRKHKGTHWVLERGSKALSKILKLVGFRMNHGARAMKSISARESYYSLECRYVTHRGRYPCDCGREEGIQARSFIDKVTSLCRDGKHEEAELMIFGDVLKKKEGKKDAVQKKRAEPSGKSEPHDCSKSPLCTEDYCING